MNPTPLMSDAQLRRRRKMQGSIGRTTSALGLAGAGIGTAAVLAAKKPGALKHIPKLKNANPEKLKEAGLYTGLASGGIGGVGGFNAAAIYSDEARRKKQTQLKKEQGMDMGYVGEEGRALTLEEIEKAWQPVTSGFDSEERRAKRQKAYQGAALTSAGAAGAYGAHHGMHAVHEAKKVKAIPNVAQLKNAQTKAGQIVTRAGKTFTALDVGHLKPAARHGGKAAIGVAAVAGAAGAHRALKRKEQGSWASYGKRSAFGVEHDPVSKAINIKPENKGKFTASAKKAGRGIQEHAHAVVRSSKATELQRKRAQFALNAKKWSHH
jgi:hypothetical protein